MTGSKRKYFEDPPDSRKRHRSLEASECRASTSRQTQELTSRNDDQGVHFTDEEDIGLDSMPLLILHKIVDNLGVSDVQSLRRVSQFFHQYVSGHYRGEVSLAGSPPNTPLPSSPDTSELSSSVNRSLNNLWVLGLSIGYNLTQLPSGRTMLSFSNHREVFILTIYRSFHISTIFPAQSAKTEEVESYRSQSYLEHKILVE